MLSFSARAALKAKRIEEVSDLSPRRRNGNQASISIPMFVDRCVLGHMEVSTGLFCLRMRPQDLEKSSCSDIRMKHSRFKHFENYVEKQWERSIKVIRSDRGLEYVNHEFEDYLAEKGIIAERTASYTPEQNGRSERDNRTIAECARSIMVASELEEELWAELCVIATYILNRTPTKQAPHSTPFELWTGKKAKISHLRKIGSVAFNHVPAVQRTKWQPKSKKFILVGYDEETDNYRLMDPKTKKVVISTNVTFHEKSNCELEESSDENTTTPIIETENGQQASEDDEDQQYESESDILSESKVKTPRENIQRQLRDRNKLKAPK